MHIRIEHRTTYLYDEPPNSIVQVLRLTPRNHEGQEVRKWRISLDIDAQLVVGEDAFGNTMHTLSVNRALDDITIAVEGEVEIQDTGGVVRGAVERFPPGLYLRETPLTAADIAIRELARETTAGKAPLEAMHALMGRLHDRIVFDTTRTIVTSTAAEAFTTGRGVCQDFAHIFIAAARATGVPARYVGGHMLRTDGPLQDAGHAWAEAYIPDLGWVGFDPANCVSPTEAHIRVSMGLDYLGAAPVRGSRSGGTAEQLQVSVSVGQMRRQQQS